MGSEMCIRDSTSTMKQELIYLRHTGSYTLTCANILLRLLLGSVDSREACKLDTVHPNPFRHHASSASPWSVSSHHAVGDGSTHSGGQWVLVQAQIRVRTSVFLFSVQSFSSETGGRRSHHCLGFSTESGILLPRNGYISLSPTLQALACASALQWVYYGRISVHRRTI